MNEQATLPVGEITFTTKNNSESMIKREEGNEIECTYNFGATNQESIEFFGEDVVHSNFRKNAVITAQGNVRRWMEPDKDGNFLTNAEIHAKLAEWKVTVGKVSTKKSAMDTILEKLRSKSMTSVEAETLKTELKAFLAVS